MKSSHGTLITFESIDGGGKTTQMTRLGVRLLDELPDRVVMLREPGGTPVAEALRELIFTHDCAQRAQALMFQAARADMYHTKVLPALHARKVVLTDRGPDSSTVFQGFVGGIEIDEIARLNYFSTEQVSPDCTILIDVPVEVAQARQTQRGDANRFDAWDASKHARVRQGYLKLAELDSRWHIIDGARPEEVVGDDIYKLVLRHLTHKGLL